MYRVMRKQIFDNVQVDFIKCVGTYPTLEEAREVLREQPTKPEGRYKTYWHHHIEEVQNESVKVVT